MSNTLHGYNWKDVAPVKDDLVKTICGLRRSADRIAPKPGQATCNVCGLRLVREAQELGLVLEDLRSWTWSDFKAPSFAELLGKEAICAG